MTKRKRSRQRRPCQKEKEVDAETLPDFSSSESLSAFISRSSNIIGNIVDTELSNLTYTSKVYENQKLRAINRFYMTLSRHDTLDHLADTIADPDNAGGNITRFVWLTRGAKTPDKKKIINTCMMLVAVSFRKRTAEKGLDWLSFWIDRTLFSKTC